MHSKSNKMHRLSFFTKASVCVLVFVMILSIMLPMFSVVPSVGAASSTLTSGKTYYIDISQYTGIKPGSNEKLVVELYNTSGNLISTVTPSEHKTNVYKFTASSGTATARLLKKNTDMPDVTASIASGKTRIFYENNNSWSTIYAYAWKGSNEPLGAWHGTQMTRVNSTKYWYIDLDSSCSDIIFNDGSTSKTGDLTIPSDIQSPLFVNGNSWIRYGVLNSVDIKAADRQSDSCDTFYVTNSSAGRWSKYQQSYSTETVYVYAPSWRTAYASFDPNDALSKVVTGANVTKNGASSASVTGFFKIEVPVGSTFTFRPNSDNTAASTANLTRPASYTQPCYVVSKSTWQELSSVNITSIADYSVGHSFGDNILAVKATYYDYLSDREMDQSHGWLHPSKSGTGHSGSNDDWYPFKNFNTALSDYYRSNNMSNAMYFGNFCNTSGAYPNGNDHNIPTSWSSYTGSLYSFNYLKNNSNGLPNSNTAYQGLVDNTLSNGKLTSSGKPVPFFDEQFLITGSTRYGYVIDSFFPFRAEDKGDYTEYSFTSVDAKDNVYFNWWGGKPKTVRYSDSSDYGVDDGLKYFMYNTASGKGIFPFNFASGHVPGSDTGYTGNNNLDYGFGIKMEIDFRVPKGGVIPGTNTPIKFTFSGDDDLWVYITDNETNSSELVLDLGGSHKESTGEINFKTKIATADNVYSKTTSSGTRYVYLTKDNAGWSNSNTYAYFYDDNGDVGKAWPGYNMSTYTGGGTNMRVVIPSGAKYVIFNNNSGKQTAKQSVSYGAYWLSSDLTVNQWDTKPSDAGLESTVESVKKTKSFNFDNTDDQKTYTMTVFYVERGLIESNMKINFTMTPLSNDLTVDKVVNVDNINSGLKQAVLNDDTFKFTVKDGGIAASSTGYTHRTAAGTVSATTTSGGSFNLKDSEQARFDSAFDNGSAITVTESANSNGGLKYSTKWTLYDGNDGSQMNNGSNTTASFTMTNSDEDSNKRVSLYLNYENTALVAPLEVHKNVAASADANPHTEFSFGIGLDLTGSGSYSKYNLEYELYEGATKVGNFTAENGKFSITSNQYVKFVGIPQGAHYQIIENVRNGYSLNSIAGAEGSNVASRTATGTVGTANSVTFTNEFNPGDTSIELWKSLDNSKTDGTASDIPAFTFRLEGIDKMSLGGGKESVDTSGISTLEAKNSQNGKIVFQNTSSSAPFTYGDIGVYRYKVTEVNEGNVLYTYDAAPIYVQVTVTADAGGVLNVAAPLFYSDAAFTNTLSKPVFNNTTNYGVIEISKLGEYTAEDGTVATEYLEGVEFTVFTDESCTTVAKDANGVDMKGVTAKVIGEGRASVVFTDVPLDTYYAVETKAVTSSVTGVHYELYGKAVKIEVKSSEQTLYDDVLRDYAVVIDREGLHIPITGGFGVTMFIVCGIALTAVSGFYLMSNSKIRSKASANFNKSNIHKK